MLPRAVDLQCSHDGSAGLWGNHLGFTVLGSRYTLALLSLPQHPWEGSSQSCALYDPEYKPPAFRRGLLDSRNSFTLPLEHWRMMLPYCCRSAWSSTQLFSDAGSLYSPDVPIPPSASPSTGRAGVNPGSWTSFADLGPSPSFLCSSPGTEEGGKKEGVELPAHPLLPLWASKALPPPAHQVPACPATGSQPSSSRDRAKCGFMDKVVLARPC